jgi:hypothetical protein|eukprot:COSAG01_NODE_10276_length_2203_cov_7.852186_3_plen_59_part_00
MKKSTDFYIPFIQVPLRQLVATTCCSTSATECLEVALRTRLGLIRGFHQMGLLVGEVR